MTVAEAQEVVCREVGSFPRGVRESGGLLGPVRRGMRLKVSRDNARVSDVVELASRRCLVGSAPRCDVRVDEPGVAPVACLIFQGSKNNVVRWLDASQEFAGGELFQDEILHAGDPLQIGPVELELLVDEIMAAEECSPTEATPGTSEDRLAEYILRLERLEIQLVELQQASEGAARLSDADDSNREVAATISDLATQLSVLQSRSATDRDLWAGEKAELEALLQSRLREFECLQDQVQRLRDELVTVRSEYGGLTASHDASQRLAEVAQALAQCREDFEREQTNWERDRSELQRQLRQNTERLEQFESQLAEQSTRQAESQAARQAAEARADRLQESVEELSQRLAEQQENYETVRAAWDVDRATLESELAAAKQRLVQSAAAESTRLELREAWERERTALQSQVAEAVLRAEEIQEELVAQRRQSEERPQRRSDAQPEVRAFDRPSEAAEQLERGDSVAPYNPMDRLLAGSSSVSDDDEPDGPLRDFLALKPSMHDDAEFENSDDTDSDNTYSDRGYGSSANQASNYYDQAFSSLRSAAYLDDATASAGDEGEEVACTVAASAPPVSTADVLARLGHSGLWSGDEADADDSSDTRTSPAGNSPKDLFPRFGKPAAAEARFEKPQSTPVNERSFASPVMSATTDHDEESIEAYMARLMNRVRATDDRDGPPQRVQTAVERSPVTEYTEVSKAPRHAWETERETISPEEYKPRSRAPEVADRMTAMRSLANDSARTAIASHAKRNWSSVMRLKLLVSMFAFVAVLASIFFFWDEPLLMGLGALVGVGVLAYWARNAITYRKLLLNSLMLEPEGGTRDESGLGDAE